MFQIRTSGVTNDIISLFMNQTKIVEEIEKFVENACKKDSNYYGYSAWTHHIAVVYKFAKQLAKKLNADEEIVGIAALLHDYASIYDKKLYPEHHLHGAVLAKKLLTKYDYPTEKIEHVKECILTHRGSKSMKRNSIEAEILASSDAMAHIASIDSVFYLAYVIHGMGVNEGTKWVLGKVERGWKKLMPEAKEIIKPQYMAIKESFKNNDNFSTF